MGVFLLIVKHIDTSDGQRPTKGLQSDTLAPHIQDRLSSSSTCTVEVSWY